MNIENTKKQRALLLQAARKAVRCTQKGGVNSSNHEQACKITCENQSVAHINRPSLMLSPDSF